jgi:acyl-CoA synthetase (AMP-forming)/AMP-acid ligase II
VVGTNREVFRPDPGPLQAGASSLGALFGARARIDPGAIALVEDDRRWTYATLNERVNRLAHALAADGVRRGDRIALLSQNCAAYIEIELAAAKLGAIVAALNWRLAAPELAYCIQLAGPQVMMVAERHAGALTKLDIALPRTITLGPAYEARLAQASPHEPPEVARPEDGLIILYTSGTTGLPKGAVISHRAMIARALAFTRDLRLAPEDGFVAWAPLFHMVSTDHALATLLCGGTVVVVDGFRPERLIEVIEQEPIGWLPLIPGMIEPLLGALRGRPFRPCGIRAIGAMADLVPPHQIAEITTMLQAPYANTFGATETGLPPGTADLVPIGATPTDLAKRQSSFCEVRLVDPDDNEVPDGEPGECAIRGATVFSGYWQAPEVNAKDFRGGWFHMGDVFARRPDGRLAFVDRAKYMIKSGGENIYPAEIERVLLADPRVHDAIVVRQADPRWGEVPVAVIVRKDQRLAEADLLARCRAELAGYKQPKEIHFVAFEALPRSTTGKIQRHEVEAWLRAAGRKQTTDT